MIKVTDLSVPSKPLEVFCVLDWFLQVHCLCKCKVCACVDVGYAKQVQLSLPSLDPNNNALPVQILYFVVRLLLISQKYNALHCRPILMNGAHYRYILRIKRVSRVCMI